MPIDPELMPTHPRRRFIGRAAAAIAAVTVGLPRIAEADGLIAPTGDASDHDAWMKSLKGKHRQFFHELAAQDRAMLMANNYLDVYQQDFGAKPEELNAVIGLHGGGLAIVMNDAAWVKYGFGKSFNVTDPATKQPSTRNVFAVDGPLSVAAAQKRGVVFLLCNMALRRDARRLSTERGESFDAVYEDLKASRLPGVIVVPALVVAINRSQEAGFTYVRT